MSQGTVQATLKNTADGHGSQFEIHLKGLELIPPEILNGIKSELAHHATLYLDGARIEGDTLVLSLCHGSIVLAKVHNSWNSDRRDNCYHVILRQEMESDENPNLPRFTE